MMAIQVLWNRLAGKAKQRAPVMILLGIIHG